MQDSNQIPQIRVSDGPNDYSPTVDRDDSPLEQWGAAGAARSRSSEGECTLGFFVTYQSRRRSVMQGGERATPHYMRTARLLSRSTEDVT